MTQDINDIRIQEIRRRLHDAKLDHEAQLRRASREKARKWLSILGTILFIALSTAAILTAFNPNSAPLIELMPSVAIFNLVQ